MGCFACRSNIRMSKVENFRSQPDIGSAEPYRISSTGQDE